MKTLKLYFQVFRVKQWVKNLFILIPGFFAGTLFNIEFIPSLIQGFFSFSFIASSIYVINDIRDIEVDRLHPVKQNRPFAAGKISKSHGYVLMTISLVFGVAGAFLISASFLYLSLTYLFMNICYSLGLKKIPILDLLIVSSGFIIRVYLGGILSDVAVTHWLSIMIFLLSLFLVLGKRSDDIQIMEEKGTVVRKTSLQYNKDFINSCITLVSGVIIVSYISYTVSPEVVEQWDSEYMFVTTIFVIAGLMRYLQLIMVEHKTGSPVDILYHDRFIIVTLLAWIGSFFLIIYI